MIEGAAESQIGECDGVTPGFERGRNVFHAEGLDAKERPQTKTLVPGHWTQEEDVHGCAVQRNIRAHALVADGDCTNGP